MSPHIRIYLLFSYGCLGGSARPRVSSLEYRFLWKYTIFVYFTSNINSCTQLSPNFFRMFGRTSPVLREFPEVWFLWKIQHSRVLYMHNIISYMHISVIFLWIFGRTGPTIHEFPGVEIPLKNTLSSCTLHLISSHVLRYLLFSFGCSGEPVQSCVSSLKYRFLWKIQHIRVPYMHNIISYTHISVIFLWIFGRTGPTIREFPGV